jgi:SAM-dependent methyltransferase
MNAVEEALLEAARLGADDDVLVLAGATLALGAQKRLGDGWVYVVRREVDELEELLREAHAVGAPGIAYLVGEPPVLPLPDAAVAAVVGYAPAEAAAELARVLTAGGRVALAAPARSDGDELATALERVGFGGVACADVDDAAVVTATRK